ncbi:unnamed protein product [Cladocopium goreaui]|uniref:Uncharacterized protein n=1 Tax=Cladocopium goreaui TaxID=2562237 RepID=A0A9P1C4E7_9DINO|nr:unnamed protein product [Cladocopium goreaui]
MADVLPTLAHLPESLQTTASFNLEEEPCRVVVSKGGAVTAVTLPKEVRSILVSRKTEGGKLAAAMRARLLGEDGQSYEALELKMAGKSACREAAIATKILQRFFPEELCISFWARFQHFEGYRAQGLTLSVVKLRKVVLTKMLPLKQKYVLPEANPKRGLNSNSHKRSHFTKTSRIAMVIAVIAAVLWATTFSAWADESCLLQGMPASQELQVEVKSREAQAAQCPDGTTDFSYDWTGLDGQFPSGGSLTPTPPTGIAPNLNLVGFDSNTNGRCIGAAIWNFDINDFDSEPNGMGDADLQKCPNGQVGLPDCHMLVVRHSGPTPGRVNDCAPQAKTSSNPSAIYAACSKRN